MKKIFPILLVVTLVVGGAVLFAIWRVSPTTAADYLEDGKKFYEAKKYDEAKIQLLNAVRKDLKNKDARYYLALTLLAQQDMTAAAKALTDLLDYYPDDPDANIKLGNIYLTAGSVEPRWFGEAGKIAAKLLLKDPNNIAALLMAGNAAAGQRDYAGSLQSFEQVASLDPQNATAFVSIGTSQTFQNHFPEAESAFLKARSLDPKNRSALVSLALYYRRTGDNAKAETAFKEAIENYPTDLAIHTGLVQLYYQTKRFDEGVRLLQGLQTKTPDNPSPSLVLNDLYLAQNRLDDARKLLFDLEKKFPKDMQVAVRLAVVLLGSDTKQAQQRVDRILQHEPNSPAGNLLQGEIQLVEGKTELAEATLSKSIVANSRMPEAQFFLGNIATRKGQLDKARTHFEKAVNMNPGYTAARVALAEILLNKGETAEGRKELEKALDMLKNSPNAEARVPARIMMAGLNRSEKRYKEADEELTALANEQPQNAVIQRQKALLADALGKPAETEKSFSKALELDPKSFETFAALVLLDAKTKQFDKAVQRIKALPEADKTARHYELLGAVYNEAGKPKDAEDSFKKALEKDPARSAADALLAGQYIKSGRLDEGIGKLNDYIKKTPNDKGAAYGVMGAAYEQKGQTPDAIKSYESALQFDPKNAAAANNLAYIYAESVDKLEIALGHAQNAKKLQPNNAEISDTLGWVYYKLGNQGLAKEHIQFAISKQPDNPTFHYHLGMVYKASKQLKESEAELRKALAGSKDPKEKSSAQDALKEVTKPR